MIFINSELIKLAGFNLIFLIYLSATKSKFEVLSFTSQATTDLRNTCTIRHTGTSASAPLAAGIVALALEVKYVTVPLLSL